MPELRILALNCGSSSLKFGIYSHSEEQFTVVLEGEAEEIGRKESSFWTRSDQKQKNRIARSITDHKEAFDLATHALSEAGVLPVDALGHRVVHGGATLRDHHRLDHEMRQELQNAVPFAPLHLPPALMVIDAVSKAMPHLPQFVCLDTAFHKDLPDVAKTLPLPRSVRELGIKRYGFHGLSVESIVEQMTTIRERTVVAHLGNGSSITALLQGRSIDTTMGMTPAGGVMMGTRTGDIDPGVLLYLLQRGFDWRQLESLVEYESGLKGVSERTSDVRELTDVRSTDPKSDLALRMFAYQVRKEIAAMAAALGGLDELIFTGGIGENAKSTRAEICAGLSFLGRFETTVMPAQEDLQIARITTRLLTL